MQERLNSNNSKRDMRKKFIKSDRPTYKNRRRRIKKAQQGIKFVSYNALDTPTIDYKDITNPINPFSEYNYSTTYNKPEALVVPVRDTDDVATDDVVVDKPTAEPVIDKPVASNPVTANSTWKSPYRDRSKWVTDLTSAYKRAGITNDNAIKMLLAQDALESSWGKSAQGKYNFGNLTTGAKWKGDYVDGRDKNAKGEAIKQRFRSYNSMDEYAADKIQFLKKLYDFNENDDINKFTAKLTGANKGKRRYAEATNYAKLLTGVYNGIPKGQNGLVINRDAIQDYRPDIPTERIRRKYSFGNLGGEPSPDITPKQRWDRQRRERTVEDWKGLLRGLNNTAGRAASLASLIYGGGWAATRLLNGNKSSIVGQALSKYVLPSNTHDTIGDVGQLIEDPSVSNAIEVGVGIGLGKWRDFSKTGRQITELGSQALNAYNSYREGGIIKYQNPPHGIARRDAIKDYRPNVPPSPIKRIYVPTQQPTISQDNRSKWERKQSDDYKAQQVKNDNLYKNQHTWNWSAPFTNARITKDNASAMFDFDKSAAMSTFAIGTGIANPVSTATSLAGSLVGSGIGNKVAGDKGALVGGFVGGMVNPKFRFGKSSSTKRREHGNVADNVNLHSKMNFDDYDQIVNAIDNEEELYRLYLQNETVAKRIREVSPSYVKEVNNFIKTKIKKRFGKPTNENYQAANRVADDAPEVTFGGVPFKYQENVYNIEPGKPMPNLEFVAHENSHGIDRAMSRLLITDYLRNLLNPSDKLPFHKWIDEVKKSRAVVDYIKRSRNLDVNNPADYSKIEKQVYKYFSDPTEIKAYFSRIPFEKYKKSVDRSFDGKVINNPVSKDIFQITDADILDDVRLQLIASIYKRNKAASYEALKSNLTNKLWGVSALGIPAINTLINGYE